MISVVPQTLIMAQGGGPCVLILVPEEELNLKKNRRVVPVWMGMPEAINLSFALEGQRTQRPMTHPLFMEAIQNLGANVDRVEIVDVKGHTFYANLILRTPARVITLDARPSDAITMAILQNAPILITDEVMRIASYPFLFKHPETDEQELADFKDFIETLSPEDFTDD